MNPINAVTNGVKSFIENADAVTIGKTVAGCIAIGGGIAIIVFANTHTDEVIQEVVEEVAEEAVNETAKEVVEEVVAEVIEN